MLTKPKSDEELWAIAQRGVSTVAVLDIVRPKIEARMQILVRDAIARFNSREKKYLPDDAMLFVAALAANQQMLDDLYRDVEDGQKAGQHFVK